MLDSRPFLAKESPMDLKTEPSLTSNDIVRCRLLIRNWWKIRSRKKKLAARLGLRGNLPCKDSKAAEPHWQLFLKGTITPLLRSTEIFISFIWLDSLRRKEKIHYRRNSYDRIMMITLKKEIHQNKFSASPVPQIEKTSFRYIHLSVIHHHNYIIAHILPMEVPDPAVWRMLTGPLVTRRL